MADIGIFTIIALDNYGAVLQAYALQRQFELMGYEAELVDLRNNTQNDCRVILKIKSPMDILRNVRQMMTYKSTKKRFALFERFVKENMRLSKNYPDTASLTAQKLPYKLLVTGSDQTFNIKLPVFKKEYYLYFEKELPKASYASSFGEFCSKFSDEERSAINEWLSEYKYIGIREEQGVNFAKEITGRTDIVRTIDPTMLIDRKEWEETAGEYDNPYGDYILFYSVLSDKWVVDEVKRIASVMNLKVIAPHMCNKYEIGADFKRVFAGPKEFLHLIKNAKFVLTTSFHASVFSVIFHKPFYAFVLEEGNRIRGLLVMLQLSDRMIAEPDKNIAYEADFTNADEILANERRKSIEYLEKLAECI